MSSAAFTRSGPRAPGFDRRANRRAIAGPFRRSGFDRPRLDLALARERHELPEFGQRAGEDANEAHASERQCRERDSRSIRRIGRRRTGVRPCAAWRGRSWRCFPPQRSRWPRKGRRSRQASSCARQDRRDRRPRPRRRRGPPAVSPGRCRPRSDPLIKRMTQADRRKAEAARADDHERVRPVHGRSLLQRAEGRQAGASESRGEGRRQRFVFDQVFGMLDKHIVAEAAVQMHAQVTRPSAPILPARPGTARIARSLPKHK